MKYLSAFILMVLVSQSAMAFGFNFATTPGGQWTGWKFTHTTGNSFFSRCHYIRHFVENNGQTTRTEYGMAHAKTSIFSSNTATCPSQPTQVGSVPFN